jgi:uncharacterized protein (DUF4213/DUF364 family)
MGIYDDLISAMEPGLKAERAVIGAHVTAVRSGLGCGLSTTLHGAGHPHGRPTVKEPAGLSGKALLELADLVNSRLPMEASLGMAAVNAGLSTEGLNLAERNGFDLLKEKAAGLNLVMVGHFSFVHEISPLTQSTAVLELDPREGDLPASAAEKAIPGADVVAITGSAFSNHTIEKLLETARGKWVMVLGPTTPLSPVLFDYGVQAVAGSLVSDADLTIRQVMEGAIFKQLRGSKRVLMLAS